MLFPLRCNPFSSTPYRPSPVSTTVIDETAVSSGEVNDVKFDPLNGNRLASASDDKTIKLWDLSSGTCQATLQGHR